jgi:hypothetical protein
MPNCSGRARSKSAAMLAVQNSNKNSGAIRRVENLFMEIPSLVIVLID